jgi:hypothetical protein
MPLAVCMCVCMHLYVCISYVYVCICMYVHHDVGVYAMYVCMVCIGSTLLITFVVENVISHGVASSPVRCAHAHDILACKYE